MKSELLKIDSRRNDSLLQVNQINFSKLTQFRQKSIVKTAVSNSIAVIGRSDFSLVVGSINGSSLENPKIMDNIVHKSDDAIEHMFVDVSGQHLILTTIQGEATYINLNTFKQLKLSRVQGSIESVAFGKEIENEMENRPFLIGTTAGMIYELQIDRNSREKSCQVVHQLNQPLAITSIFFDYLGVSEKKRLYVLFATSSPTRLYHTYTSNFTSFRTLFEQASQGSALTSSLTYIEFPGDINRAELHCYGVRSKSMVEQNFALMTESGIYHGSITFPVTKHEEVSVEAQLLPYSATTATSHAYEYNPSSIPVSIAPSAYHFVILTTEKHVLIVNKLSGEIVIDYTSQQVLNKSLSQILQSNSVVSSIRNPAGQVSSIMSVGNSSLRGGSQNPEVPLGFISDKLTTYLYLFTESSLYQIQLVDEERDIWRIYLKKALNTGEDVAFERAAQLCKSKEERRNVIRAQAEYFFLKHEFSSASQLLGKSVATIPFDEAVLRLLGVCPLALDYELDQVLNDMYKSSLTDSNDDSRNTKTSSSYYSKALNTYGVIESFIKETDINQTFLRIYLLQVLQNIPVANKSQKTMIASWICEIYIHEIACKIISDSFSDVSSKREDLKSSLKQSLLSYRNEDGKASVWEYFRTNIPSFRQAVTDMEMTLEEEFKEFLATNRSLLDRAVTFNQILSRGSALSHQSILLFYAQTISDYEQVVGQLIGELKYNEAISLLHSSPLENVENLIYKWSSLLIVSNPSETVKMLVSKPKLKPNLLLPSLLRYCQAYDIETSSNSTSNFIGDFPKHFALEYLENYFFTQIKSSIRTSADATLYHSFIWMLCKYESKSEEKLCSSLSLENDLLNESLPIEESNRNLFIDYDFILRQCTTFQRQRGATLSYILLGLLEESVDKALSFDIEFAKSIAKLVSDESRRKSLWLKIAVHTIKLDRKPHRSLMILKECNNAITIQDLLPHLPDFTEVDLLKDDICKALEDSSARLDSLKREMSELFESSQGITQELDSIQKSGYTVSAYQKCEYCTDLLFIRQFYLFPCSHGFHCDCLYQRLVSEKWLDASQLATISKIEEQIKPLKSRSLENDKRSLARLEYLQRELDGCIGADCPLCGYVMIQSLSKSLLANETESEIHSWQLL